MSFWPLMLTTLALSILLLIIFIVISWERVNHNKEKQIRMSYGKLFYKSVLSLTNRVLWHFALPCTSENAWFTTQRCLNVKL